MQGEKPGGGAFPKSRLQRHGWMWGIKRGDSCPPRCGGVVTHTEWISVDVEASLVPVHWAGFDCFVQVHIVGCHVLFC